MMNEVKLLNMHTDNLQVNELSGGELYNCVSSFLQSIEIDERFLSTVNYDFVLKKPKKLDSLILGTLSKKLTDKQQASLLAKLDAAYLSGQDQLNGNSNRRVIGSIPKKERDNLSVSGTSENNKAYNKFVDKRQSDFLESVGSVVPYYESSIVNEFKGKDKFKHNPNLTNAFEVLKREARERGQVLGFITVQLSKKVTAKLHAEDAPASALRKLIVYRLEKLMSGPVRAALVLERSHSVRYEIGSCDGAGSDLEEGVVGLHVHIVLIGKKEEIDALKDVNISYSLRSLSTPAANAIKIKYDYEISRLDEEKGGLRPYCIVKTTLPIDGGVMDYLSKELHKPISSAGCQNFAFIGIRGAVKSLWEQRYIKQRKLDELVVQIRAEINSGTHPGDIKSRLFKVLEE